MAKYRKKPVVIEAVKWTGDNFVQIDDFITVNHETFPSAGMVMIPTLEGVMKADIGDYIIKGVNGEFYPCKPDIFEKTYEPAQDLDEGRWFEAIAIARYMLEEYKKIPTGAFGAMGISTLITRYENGERTIELLEELESIK